MRDRLATESVEEREARLQQMSTRQRERLATESAEEKEARLQQMRDRLATESAEEREVRLQQMSTCQRERLAVETNQQREDRLQRASERDREQSQLVLFEQRSVQVKMRRFHAHFASLNSSRCSTCSESSPGLQFRPPSTEYVRCCRDKHVPKMCSSANNMDLAPYHPSCRLALIHANSSIMTGMRC